MFWFVVGLLVGGLGSFVGLRHVMRQRPELARKFGLPVGGTWVPRRGEKPPAVDPNAMPDTMTKVEVEQGAAETLPDEDLKQLVKKLVGWSPRRHRTEKRFHNNFGKFLLDEGYSPEEIQREPRVFWSLQDGAEEQRYAMPDFIIRNRVLVEIKRDLTISSTTDRSLGQMLRYLMAWRSEGPALLLVCNEYDENLRLFVQRSVQSWKAQGVPVMAFFVRSAESEAALAEVPATPGRGVGPG